MKLMALLESEQGNIINMALTTIIFDYPKEDLRRSYRDMSLSWVSESTENDIGVNFDPHIVLHGFTREGKADESSWRQRFLLRN